MMILVQTSEQGYPLRLSGVLLFRIIFLFSFTFFATIRFEEEPSGPNLRKHGTEDNAQTRFRQLPRGTFPRAATKQFIAIPFRDMETSI